MFDHRITSRRQVYTGYLEHVFYQGFGDRTMDQINLLNCPFFPEYYEKQIVEKSNERFLNRFSSTTCFFLNLF